jgi:glycosyltransferase involved in cell wall biosynthesis
VKVLQVHNGYRLHGGEDVVVQAEAEVLRDGGHQVIQHLVENPTNPLRAAVALGMAAWNSASARGITRLVQREQPDVAHVHNTWFSLSPSVVASLDRLGVPVIMTLHNYRVLCGNAMLFRDGKPCEKCVGSHPWHGVRHRCYRGSTIASSAAATTIAVNSALHTWERHVRLFIALNEFARQRFIAGGLPADKIVVKPNHVADPGPRPAAPSQSDVVLFVGRLSHEKGVHVLLEAWQRIRHHRMRLVVVGDGPMREALERQQTKDVSFIGPLPPHEVRRWMLSARAFVFPSLCYEVQPMTVLEAFAARLPVLASRLGGNVDLLSTGEDEEEWLVPPGDAQRWAAALERLADKESIDTGGEAARERYEADFSHGEARARLEAVYSSARGLG